MLNEDKAKLIVHFQQCRTNFQIFHIIEIVDSWKWYEIHAPSIDIICVVTHSA